MNVWIRLWYTPKQLTKPVIFWSFNIYRRRYISLRYIYQSHDIDYATTLSASTRPRPENMTKKGSSFLEVFAPPPTRDFHVHFSTWKILDQTTVHEIPSRAAKPGTMHSQLWNIGQKTVSWLSAYADPQRCPKHHHSPTLQSAVGETDDEHRLGVRTFTSNKETEAGLLKQHWPK